MIRASGSHSKKNKIIYFCKENWKHILFDSCVNTLYKKFSDILISDIPAGGGKIANLFYSESKLHIAPIFTQLHSQKISTRPPLSFGYWYYRMWLVSFSSSTSSLEKWLFFMSFCRILSTLCRQVVFHIVPHFSHRRQKSGTKSTA